MSSAGSRKRKARVAITMGDPCGIGPEVLAKALLFEDLWEEVDPVVIGETLALRRALSIVDANPDLADTFRVTSPVKLSLEDIVHGRPTGASCRAVIGYIEAAVRMALDGEVDAVCTCPIHKEHLHEHGFRFPGHTEFIRDLTKADDVVMMLAGPKLRVALVTIHHPIAEVPKLLTPQRLHTTIRITGEALLRDFAIESPRLAVAGLNPHAGEGGLFGDEEAAVIRPAIGAFRDGPFEVSGPYPPDTLFRLAFEGRFDAVVAMYHDQGLIPIKLVHFDDAVNISLGLPIVRTSVDHGTAYDIAGTGQADPSSLRAAVKLAASMARNRARI